MLLKLCLINTTNYTTSEMVILSNSYLPVFFVNYGVLVQGGSVVMVKDRIMHELKASAHPPDGAYFQSHSFSLPCEYLLLQKNLRDCYGCKMLAGKFKGLLVVVRN